MSATAQRHLLRTALIAFALADVLVWTAFVFNQWFAVPFWEAWGLAALLALPATMLLLPLIDSLLDKGKNDASVPFVGNQIPGAGQ